MNYFEPLEQDEEHALEELYKSAPMGRDRLYHLFTSKYPEMTVSRRAVFDFLTKQEVHQIWQKPVITKGVVKPVTSSKRGSVQLDCIQLSAFNGFNSALVCIDTFTKKVYVAPLKGQTADEVVKGFKGFLDAGMYVKFLNTDNGKEFFGGFPDLCKDNGIALYRIRPHSPWANGLVERVNGTIKSSLFQSMALKNTKDWVSLMPLIVSNYNNTINRSTKKSPNDIEDNYHEVRKEVGKRILNYAKGNYKQKVTDDVEVGDYCRLRLEYDPTNIRKGSKVGYWGKDIFQVTEIIKSRKFNQTPSYKLKNTSDQKLLPGRFARWQILKIPDPETMKKMPEQIQDNPPPDPETGEYEVESILDRRTTRNGKVQYRVKWVGWKVPTWEDEDNLKNADLMVRTFNRIYHND
jgi:hypothetical protein